MIGQTISHTELTLWSSTSRVVDLSKFSEERNSCTGASPSLSIREEERGDEFAEGRTL